VPGPDRLQSPRGSLREPYPDRLPPCRCFFTCALLQALQHLLDCRPVLPIALESFMRFGKTVVIQHYAHEHLLAIGSLVPGTTSLGLGLPAVSPSK
jgi:hypothetical protein